MAYLLLAGLATPLVLSVHSVVSWDFAMAQLPGWHSTIFAPYFVAGAIFSGVAMVLTLLIPMRWVMGLEDLITPWHLDNLAKVVLLTSLIVSYAYIVESFMAWYSHNKYEMAVMKNRIGGPFMYQYWALLACNILAPQLLWFKAVRNNPPWLFLVALVVLAGMWLERYVIVITSLHRDFLPSSWGMYYPTIWDIATFAGTIGLFLCLLFLFVRFLPMIALSEVKACLPAVNAPHSARGPKASMEARS